MIVRDRPMHRLTLECDDKRAGQECRVSVDITSDTAEKCLAIVLEMGWIQGPDGRQACPVCSTRRKTGDARASREIRGESLYADPR